MTITAAAVAPKKIDIRHSFYGRERSEEVAAIFQNRAIHGRIGHQDRAALINMSANLALSRIILQETERSSWQLIWNEELKGRFTSASKPDTGDDLSKGALIPDAEEPKTTDFANGRRKNGGDDNCGRTYRRSKFGKSEKGT